jgi:hypothetical protein
MKSFLLLLLLLVVPATGQEHAPIAAQCQADAAVWGDTALESKYLDASDSPTQTEIGRLGLKEVMDRINEMRACLKTDPARQARYYEIAMWYTGSVLSGRVYDFMTRHDLWPQFRLEDGQGKR